MKRIAACALLTACMLCGCQGRPAGDPGSTVMSPAPEIEGRAPEEGRPGLTDGIWYVSCDGDKHVMWVSGDRVRRIQYREYEGQWVAISGIQGALSVGSISAGYTEWEVKRTSDFDLPEEAAPSFGEEDSIAWSDVPDSADVPVGAVTVSGTEEELVLRYDGLGGFRKVDDLAAAMMEPL